MNFVSQTRNIWRTNIVLGAINFVLGQIVFEIDQCLFHSSMENTLVKVDRNDWHILRNMYEKSGEEYYLTYAVIDNFIQLFEQDQNVKHVNLFCLNGDYSDGTFVMIVSIKIFHLNIKIFEIKVQLNYHRTGEPFTPIHLINLMKT